MHEKLLTTGQCAKLIGCAPRTIAKWIDDGMLKGYRLPRKNSPGDRRVSRAVFDQFCKEHEIVVLAPYGDPTSQMT